MLIDRLVIGLLRSPLSRALGKSLLLVTYRGRRTRELHTFPAMYAREGNRVIVVAARAHEKQWWRQLEGGAETILRVLGEEAAAHGELVAERSARRGRLLRRYLARFPLAARPLGIGTPVAELDDTALGASAPDAEVVLFTLAPEDGAAVTRPLRPQLSRTP
jgi:hypothetical protein